jgi:hypothetical protein
MKSPVPCTALGLLFSRLADWNSIVDFEQAMQDYFSGERSQAEIADFRAKRGALKVLRDEVSPVLHHLRFVKAKGEVKFALNNTVPDCWLREDPTGKPQGLEVTVAQSREQHYLGRELNEKRMSRGFLGLPDSASSKAFSDRLARPRVMYSTGSALEVIGNGIKSCLKKKADAKYAGFDLLVEAPLRSLPNERWNQIEDDLRSAASEMPFREIHVIGNQDTEPFGFRIK